MIIDLEDGTPRQIDEAAAEDRAYRLAWGGKDGKPFGAVLRSAYSTIIGDAPKCDRADHVAAREYLRRIELAIDQGGWKGSERTRLYRMRKTWKARAEGKDPRFEIAGTRPGRLPRETERMISSVVKPPSAEKKTTTRTRGRRVMHDWSPTVDLDAPLGPRTQHRLHE